MPRRNRVSTMSAFGRIVTLALVGGCGSSPPDACERALARLERIHAARDETSPAKLRDTALEHCRRNRTTPEAQDPVVRCALEEATEQDASECIDELMKNVLKPGATGGSGINPLLED